MKFNVKAFVIGVILSVLFVCVRNIYSCELSVQSGIGIYSALKAGRIENLYIGSSMFRKGITLYGYESDSFLICYNGLDPVTESVILEYLFRNGLSVKNIYVDMYAYSASREPNFSDTRLMFDSPFKLKFSLWEKVMKNADGYLSYLWEFFINAGNDMFILWPVYTGMTSGRYYRGGYSSQVFYNGMTPEAAAQSQPPETEGGKMNGPQKEAIISIIELCRKYNASVIFVETPKYEAVADNAGYISVMNEYVNLLSVYGVKCIISRGTLNRISAGAGKNIHAYDFPCEDTSMFQDHIHLSTDGNRKFMKVLRYIHSGN